MNKKHSVVKVVVESNDQTFEHGEIRIESGSRYVETDVEIDCYLVIDKDMAREFKSDLENLIKKYAL